MTDVNLILIGCLVILALGLGILVGWLVSARKRQTVEHDAIELRTRIQSNEQFIADLRQKIAEKEQGMDQLRENAQQLQNAKTVSETKLEETLKNLNEQKKMLEDSTVRLTETFKALSGDSLKSNNKAFLELAQETLGAALNKVQGELGEKEQSIKGIVGPLEEALKRYEAKIGEVENKRATDFGSLDTQIKLLATLNQGLQKETGNLVSALRRPEVRGRWGEITLRRVVELSGMSEHCDFTEQVTISTDDARLRPDMVVHLPGGRDVVVDSKAPLDAFMDAVNADTIEKRREAIARHAQQARKHMKSLSGKGYADQFPTAPEYVVMFMPGESFLSAALENDPTLIEDGMETRVLLATPTTLVALLRAVAFGWRQEQIAKNSLAIAELGRQLYERFGAFLGHVDKTRGSIEQSVFNFNRMLGSLDGRILPSLKKFKELGATGAAELIDVKAIDQQPRALSGERVEGSPLLVDDIGQN